MIDQAQTILKNTFGYDEFRPLQREIIQNVLKKNDTLVVMPTGGGKSLCYQIPALIFPGMTVVVSPLISLMKDQVEQLTELGVQAAFLNSSLSWELYRQTVGRIVRNEVRLLYLAPETLFKEKTLILLSSVKVDCLTIDEAHCISEWGHDFRPEYRKLIEIRRRFPSAVCIALTATATPRVREDIAGNLGFDRANEFIGSFNRKNLVIQIKSKNDPLAQSLQFLQKFPNQSGIIYCFSRKQVDDLYEVLQEQGFSVRPYHAGLSETERKQNQELFIRDDVQIIVATIAFGMGINKPNVRFVIHYDLPKDIETYYQEIGRAGRDGLPSHCLLLYGYGDVQKIKYFIAQKSEQEQKVATLHLNDLLRFIETDACRRVPLLTYFGEDYSAPACDACDNCREGEKELVDITIPAQKFLSCVKRTGERFGINHIIDVLRGSQSQNVLKYRHQNLSTYGIGKEYSKRQWFNLARQFIQQGLMVQDMEFGSLKLTGKTYEVFQGTEKVMGRIEQQEAADGQVKGGAAEYDQGLFELLRAKRKELADTANVPPYIVFPDKTLMEIATFFPHSKESLLNIQGIGLAKFEKYGGIFLAIIEQYCQEHGIQERPKYTGRQTTGTSKPISKRKHTIVGEAYNEGKSVEELMEEFGVKQDTILDHLSRYLQEGHPVRSDGLLKLSTLSAEQQALVLKTIDQVGTGYLKPIFEALNEAISYTEIKVLHLYYITGKRTSCQAADGE
ncbi:MAG: DNA helicase RecQ [bacterium]